MCSVNGTVHVLLQRLPSKERSREGMSCLGDAAGSAGQAAWPSTTFTIKPHTSPSAASLQRPACLTGHVHTGPHTLCPITHTHTHCDPYCDCTHVACPRWHGQQLNDAPVWYAGHLGQLQSQLCMRDLDEVHLPNLVLLDLDPQANIWRAAADTQQHTCVCKMQ